MTLAIVGLISACSRARPSTRARYLASAVNPHRPLSWTGVPRCACACWSLRRRSLPGLVPRASSAGIAPSALLPVRLPSRPQRWPATDGLALLRACSTSMRDVISEGARPHVLSRPRTRLARRAVGVPNPPVDGRVAPSTWDRDALEDVTPCAGPAARGRKRPFGAMSDGAARVFLAAAEPIRFVMDCACNRARPEGNAATGGYDRYRHNRPRILQGEQGRSLRGARRGRYYPHAVSTEMPMGWCAF